MTNFKGLEVRVENILDGMVYTLFFETVDKQLLTNTGIKASELGIYVGSPASFPSFKGTKNVVAKERTLHIGYEGFEVVSELCDGFY